MLALLNDLLDFKKIDVGRLEFDPHPFDLKSMLRALAEAHGKAVAAGGAGRNPRGAWPP